MLVRCPAMVVIRIEALFVRAALGVSPDIARWRRCIAPLLACLLIATVTMPARAQFSGPFSQQFDPTQPGPLPNMASGFNPNGYGFTVSPPAQPTAATRPTNWTGRARPRADGLPGVSLDDAEPFRPGEAEQWARQYAEQRARGRPISGQDGNIPSIYGPRIEAILRSPYQLSNHAAEPVPVVTTTRLDVPSAPEVRQVAHQETPTAGPDPPGAGPGSNPRPIPPAASAEVAGAEPPIVEPARPLGSTGQSGDLTDPTLVIARVDKEVILLGDLLMSVNETLEKNAGKFPKSQAPRIRKMLIQNQLKPIVDIKLAYADLKRKVPEKNLEKINKQVGDMWEKEEYPKKLRQANVSTRAQLDATYRKYGTTIEREKKGWMEIELGRQWVGQNIKFDEDISHEEMLTRYHAQIARYEYPAGARWEELKVGYDSPAARRVAWRKIAQAGNQVLSGVSFAEMAKLCSQGATAKKGGQREWTAKDSLASELLNEALFSLPLGQLSPIIDDGKALYIIRVVERREAGVVPFTEAQIQIKEQIKKERLQQQQQEFLAKLHKQYRVWTIFDEEKAEQQLEVEGPQMRIGRAGS